MENKTKQEHLRIKNDVNELAALTQKLEELGEQWQLSVALVTNLNLVLEEAISNIIFYAFEDKKEHLIDLDFVLEDTQMTITITDDGKPFDPTKKESPDITLSADEREVGGLGIFLMGKIMDSLKYKRENKKNILILKKEI
ncbi:MAG TPA: ATP-binding protein [Bacteroidales bacterium]|nr:ATP-binding protein [Bacteroidales bacterium]